MARLTKFYNGVPRAILRVEKETKTQYVLSNGTKVMKGSMQERGDSGFSLQWFAE